MPTSDEDRLAALQRAAEILGQSPTKAESEELGLTPASGTIVRTMGGWNAAKRAAGLATYESRRTGGAPIQSKPDHVELPDGAVWQELTPQ